MTDTLDLLCCVGLAGVASQGGVAFIDGGSFTATNCDFSSNIVVRDLLACLCAACSLALHWSRGRAVFAVTDALELLCCGCRLLLRYRCACLVALVVAWAGSL